MFSLVGGAMEAAESGNGGSEETSGEGLVTEDGGRSESSVRSRVSEVIRDM